jgi:hypothetical protein
MDEPDAGNRIFDAWHREWWPPMHSVCVKQSHHYWWHLCVYRVHITKLPRLVHRKVVPPRKAYLGIHRSPAHHVRKQLSRVSTGFGLFKPLLELDKFSLFVGKPGTPTTPDHAW